MIETNIFEALLKIEDDSLDIKLESITGYKNSKITIVGRGKISKETLWKILKLVDKNKAQLNLLSYGVIEITF